MRILIISNKSGAMVDFRYELISELLIKNEVVIATPFDDKMDELRTLDAKLIESPVDRRGLNPLKDLKLLRNYIRIIRAEKPDIVVTYTIKPNIYGGLACRYTRVPYAANITGLGTAFQTKGMVKKIVITLYKAALKKAKTVFFENSGNRDELLSYGVCKKEQTCVLNGAGVNIEKFYFQEYPRNNIFHFLFVGRIMKEKGVDELLEAVKRLRENGFNCVLDMVGQYEEDYREKIENAKINGQIIFHGFQRDVRPLIEQADCFCLPSYHEGMANTNLECAASGRPVITSNIPGCKEAVLDGISGYLCEPKDVESLYSTMERMLELKTEKRAEMGRAGRRHIEELFDKQKVVGMTIERILD